MCSTPALSLSLSSLFFTFNCHFSTHALRLTLSRGRRRRALVSTPHAIIKPAGWHTLRRSASSSTRVSKLGKRTVQNETVRVLWPAQPPRCRRVLAPCRNRLGKRALRNLLGVLARRARQDALELRLHQRLASRVVPEEGGNQWSSMVISGACWLASYRRHVLNDPQRRAATCGLNLSSASTCEQFP